MPNVVDHSQPVLRPLAARLWEDPTDSGGLGGKGASLANLIEAGLPVPRTGMVTAAAYETFVANDHIAALIGRIHDGEAVPAEEVDRVFQAAPCPPTLRDAIVDLALAVGGSDGKALAVRSSATVEDLEGSSFAGQYRSLLQIDSTDPDAVLDAVRLVWASLWHPAPTAYRRAFGIADSDVAMAVVLMAMVPATSAGVVFTLDPGGEADSARVESVDGLGESLVSGRRTPTAWVVPRDKHDDLPEAERQALKLALSIEVLTDQPQDVEWAAEGTTVSVVQARPITVLESQDGFDSPLDQHELTTAGITEMVPGVLGALSWDINSFLLEEAFRSVLASLGLLTDEPAEGRDLVRRVRGRVALDFDLLRTMVSSTPGAARQLEEQYFGIATAEGDEAMDPPGRWQNAVRAVRTMRTRRQVIDTAEVLIETVGRLRSEPIPLEPLSDTALVAHIGRLIDLASRGLTAELGVAAAAAAAYHRLELLLEPHLGADEAEVAARKVITLNRREATVSPNASAAIFGGPSWAERGVEPPVPPQGPDQSTARTELEATLQSLPGWRRKRIMTGQFVDVRVHLIRRTIVDAAEQLERREATKAAFLELGGAVREAHLEVGKRLAERGTLPNATDVQLLSSAELVAALDGTAPATDALGRRRNWIGRYENEGELPVRFVGIPDREPAPLPEGDTLEGWAASAGRYRGQAVVARSAEADLPDGAVLVAESTDASWSPLFIRAGAVVVERGGPLSHAAILARELGLPAVLNVPGATAALDGCTVSVDGDQGLVVIEEGQPDAGE